MKKEKQTLTKEALLQAIEKKQSKTICSYIADGVLDEMDNEELYPLFRGLMKLRNQEVIDELAKRASYFPIEMLDTEIKNHNDKHFVSYVLGKYGKKFRYKQAAVANRLFETACRCDCKSMLLFLIGKGAAEGEYPRLISGSDALLEVLKRIKVSALHPDTQVTFFVEAAVAHQNEKRLQELLSLGFDITLRNEEGKTAAEVLEEGIARFAYSKDKKGAAEKQRDLQGLKLLQRTSEQYL